jgi:hypothetical protein
VVAFIYKKKARIGRPIHRWGGGGYIKIDLKEIGYVAVDWMHLAQYLVQWRALMNTVINDHVP